MSYPVLRISNGVTFNAKVTGELLNGWLPGTIVNIVSGNDKKYISIDVATTKPDVQGAFAFILNGSMELGINFDNRFPNDNELSRKWTPDETVHLAKTEENKVLELDKKDKMLSKLGTGVTTVNYDGGVFKVYTYEKYDKEYLESNGESGEEIDWTSHIGESLGCSSRNLFTTLDNNVLKEGMEYRLGGVFEDENRKKYILIVRK